MPTAPTFDTYMYPVTRKRWSCLELVLGRRAGHHLVIQLHIRRRFPRDYR